jgi:hypothetical protein
MLQTQLDALLVPWTSRLSTHNFQPEMLSFTRPEQPNVTTAYPYPEYLDSPPR